MMAVLHNLSMVAMAQTASVDVPACLACTVSPVGCLRAADREGGTHDIPYSWNGTGCGQCTKRMQFQPDPFDYKGSLGLSMLLEE